MTGKTVVSTGANSTRKKYFGGRIVITKVITEYLFGAPIGYSYLIIDGKHQPQTFPLWSWNKLVRIAQTIQKEQGVCNG